MRYQFLTLKLELKCIAKLVHAFLSAPLFAFKTFLYRIWPGGYGYMRILRREASNITLPFFDKPTGKVIRKFGYENYQQYKMHQAYKFNEILHKHGGFSNLLIMRWRLIFFEHLQPLKKLLPTNAKILCVGARQGTEVEVLRDLGFLNTAGCDLNPGPKNPYVVYGDFMDHIQHDASFDAIYTNAIDHALDLKLFFKEQARILKHNGYGVFDFAEFNIIGGPSDYEVQFWEYTDEPISVMSKYFPKIISDRVNGEWRTVIAQRN